MKNDNGGQAVPSRDLLLRQFGNPPSGFGPIDCWWWEGGRLDKEQMRWQLEDMREKGISGTWYYPRFVHGQPLSCDPEYWTEKWWEFTRFAIEEHRRLGLIYWFSDWTSHEYFQDVLRQERAGNPSLGGRRLVVHEEESAGPGLIEMKIPPEEEIADAAAYRRAGEGLDYDSRRELKNAVADGRLVWEAPGAGWVVAVVSSQPFDLDYLSRGMTGRWIELVLGPYEERFGEFMGNTIQSFGTDEWRFMKGNILHSSDLMQRFREEKGYDPAPYLVGLFRDIGRSTDMIRCQYYEVMSSLLVENLYRPFASWLEERGMIFTEFCPRGKWENMLEGTHHYGDFFRYMGTYHIPGNEERCLDLDRVRTFQAKMASSIAHLHGRSRVGVCVYWGSGWGHNTQENLAWTHENYAYGANLYNRHGVLYTTLGGWFEWVPPAVHFRQPYWRYWRHFSEYLSRLSYILSQGVHRADAAFLYPQATIHANWEDREEFNAIAREVNKTTYDLGKRIYRSGIDFDFIDDYGMERAAVEGGLLKVAGLEFRAVVMPPQTTMRLSTLRKVREFRDGGGTVVSYGRLPGASAENGRDDAQLRRLLQEIFGVDSSAGVEEVVRHGRASFVPAGQAKVAEILSESIERDVVASAGDVYHTHQQVGSTDVYFLFNNLQEKRRISFDLRVAGAPEVWEASSGIARPLHRFEVRGGRTRAQLDMEPFEAVVLVFGGSKGVPQVVEDDLTIISKVKAGADGLELDGFDAAGGEKMVRILHAGREYAAEGRVDAPPQPLALDGEWDFRLEPTMNNQWGDFRHPAAKEYIGAEVRRLRYREAAGVDGVEEGWHLPHCDDSEWERVTYSHGPYWWTIGPFAPGEEPADLLRRARNGEVDSAEACEAGGATLRWRPYSFSQKHGYESREGTSAMQVALNMNGLTGVPKEFLVFQAVDADPETAAADIEAPPADAASRTESGGREGEAKVYQRYLFTWIWSPEDREYVFDFGGETRWPRQAWVNGREVVAAGLEEAGARAVVRLNEGHNAVFLRIGQPAAETIETYAAFCEGEVPAVDPYLPLLPWFGEGHRLVYDISPRAGRRVGWYRFSAPPGVETMRMHLQAEAVQAWVDGRPVRVEKDRVVLDAPEERASQVALRVVQKPGCYAGAAFSLPVAFECAAGRIPPGDWCDHGLREYSGGGVYTTTVELRREHLRGMVVLDLGRVVATAEVEVNGRPAGVRMALPFRFDISGLVREGENRVEVKVVNTLANHMSSYPTNFVYDGQMVSGMLGPVRIEFLSKVGLQCAPLHG